MFLWHSAKSCVAKAPEDWRGPKRWRVFERFSGLVLWLIVLSLLLLPAGAALAASAGYGEVTAGFPRALASYVESKNASLCQVLKERIQAEPFNLLATVIFFLAIIHTFLAPKFLQVAHRFELPANAGEAAPQGRRRAEVRFVAKLFHFLGEVEVIFGIWVVPLLVAITLFKGWPAARDYLGRGLEFTEPVFVVVIMAMAASGPVLRLSERLMAWIAGLGGGSPAAWWLAILTFGPLLGSLITEPAAMTISALLLARKFYRYQPTAKLAYATLGLLFVNVSVGGTLTHFAAPPVLMVAAKWEWGARHMLTHFGWKAVLGILAANALYFACFHRDLRALGRSATAAAGGVEKRAAQQERVPAWITLVHLLFLVWTVMNSHYPALFIGGFLFYIGFTQATSQYQSELALRPALLVGFFLAGLVVHGGLQGWWIAPLLSRLGEKSLFFGAAALTAFNDNAAITYLAALVPNFSAALKYAVMAGAVAGGGLTVIANAPNPAGQSLLSEFFPGGVSPLRLFFGALFPTIIVSAAFLLLG